MEDGDETASFALDYVVDGGGFHARAGVGLDKGFDDFFLGGGEDEGVECRVVPFDVLHAGDGNFHYSRQYSTC